MAQALTRACIYCDANSVAATGAKGAASTVLQEAPLARLQNTIVVQSLRERVFGLGTLGFATAGRGTFDAFWETVRQPFAVHRTVLEAVERYGRRS